jgi:hypothetical protein
MVSLAIVETEYLLIKIAKQMIRLNTNIRAFDTPLQETPKVIYAAGMNLTVNILLRVVNYLVKVISMKAASLRREGSLAWRLQSLAP